ncbi:hypothetical protein [Desulfosediminicola ganghwensis]|uniref:hypothetical protein n=1 Tax=Desulfosediminicola ganghwensis TaxID=2569540 RepID=UPI0010AC8722|nr:hypothetical protein [Desulfosediminicola ganghwensis]
MTNTNDDVKKGGGLFAKLTSKLSANGEQEQKDDAENVDADASDNLEMIEEYNLIKQNPEKITGWDFDRAFDFMEKYPTSDYVSKVRQEMYSTNSDTLKGLSYASAVRVLKQLPDHPGVPSILNGMTKLEEDYIRELSSDVITYMLERIPDHPLKDQLAAALADKNLTKAFGFVVGLPNHPCVPLVIRKMFDSDANIATLLLHEVMDHPQVDAIFKGIYSISEEAVAQMTPDAIIFILEVASDHEQAGVMLDTLVAKNYVKAYDFVKNNPENELAPRLKEIIINRKPDLAALLK